MAASDNGSESSSQGQQRLNRGELARSEAPAVRGTIVCGRSKRIGRVMQWRASSTKLKAAAPFYIALGYALCRVASCRRVREPPPSEGLYPMA